VSLWMFLWAIGSLSRFAQKTSRTLEDLEREFTEPLTTLPQPFLKDTFFPVNHGTDVQTNQWLPGSSFHESHQTPACLSSNSFGRPFYW